MPGYFSYVAKFDSPGFFWDNIPDENFRTGNTPGPRIIPAEFSEGLGFAPGVVDYWAKKSGLQGKQLDWGGWGIIVSKADMEMIWKTEETDRRWLDEKEWLDIWNQIEKLDDGEKYVLVVAENP
jgi:hypothetical protein